MTEYFNFSQSGLMSFSPTAQLGSSTNKKSEITSFESLGIEELESKNISNEDNSIFYAVYDKNCYMYQATTPEEVLRVSLTSPCILPATLNASFCYSHNAGVFIRKNGQFKLLYKSGRFCCDKNPVFLSKTFLKRILSDFFENIEITLGQLIKDEMKYIAWMITTEKGIFYIPWHNGIIFPATNELVFIKNKFNKIEKTYKLLRFCENFSSNEYKVLRG